jgi:hypothetical protein
VYLVSLQHESDPCGPNDAFLQFDREPISHRKRHFGRDRRWQMIASASVSNSTFARIHRDVSSVMSVVIHYPRRRARLRSRTSLGLGRGRRGIQETNSPPRSIPRPSTLTTPDRSTPKRGLSPVGGSRLSKLRRRRASRAASGVFAATGVRIHGAGT